MKIPENLDKGGFSNQSVPEWVDKDRMERIVSFIRPKFKKIKTINYKISSYGIKHDVERAIGYYISNGELIAAMILLGFSYKRGEGKSAINCYFNVSMESLKSI